MEIFTSASNNVQTQIYFICNYLQQKVKDISETLICDIKGALFSVLLTRAVCSGEDRRGEEENTE